MNLQLKQRQAQNRRQWLSDKNGQTVLKFSLFKETYQYVVEMPKKVVEKVPQMVKETYEYMKPINTARMETAQAIRELPDQVIKKIDDIAPKKGPLASQVGFNVGLAGVAMGTVAMVVSTFITPAETAQAMVQGLTNTVQGATQYVKKAAHDPNLVLQDGQKLVNASVEWIQNSSDYEKGKLTGKVVGEVGLMLVGAGEAKAGLKTAGLAEVATAKVGLKAEAKIVTEKALLKESGVIGARELEQTAVSQARQTYKVLMEPDVTGKIYNLRLTEDGKFRYFVNGQRYTVREVDFVLQDGKLIFGERHSFIAKGGSVDYAGRMRISADGKSIDWWNNGSGHYKPKVDDLVGQQKVQQAFKEQFGDMELPGMTPHKLE